MMTCTGGAGGFGGSIGGGAGLAAGGVAGLGAGFAAGLFGATFLATVPAQGQLQQHTQPCAELETLARSSGGRRACNRSTRSRASLSVPRASSKSDPDGWLRPQEIGRIESAIANTANLSVFLCIYVRKTSIYSSHESQVKVKSTR